MANNKTHISLRLSQETLSRIDDIALEKAMSRAEVVRQCVELAFPFFDVGVIPNPHRTALVSEFNQIALELLIEELNPDLIPQIIEAAQHRMSEFHAELHPLRLPQANPDLEAAQ